MRQHRPRAAIEYLKKYIGTTLHESVHQLLWSSDVDPIRTACEGQGCGKLESSPPAIRCDHWWWRWWNKLGQLSSLKPSDRPSAGELFGHKWLNSWVLVRSLSFWFIVFIYYLWWSVTNLTGDCLSSLHMSISAAIIGRFWVELGSVMNSMRWDWWRWQSLESNIEERRCNQLGMIDPKGTFGLLYFGSQVLPQIMKSNAGLGSSSEAQLRVKIHHHWVFFVYLNIRML